MSQPLRDRVLAALDSVLDPCSMATRRPLGIVEMGLLVALDVDAAGDVHAVLRATSPSCVLIASILEAAEERVSAVPGVRSVDMAVDAFSDWTPELMTPAGRRKLEAARARDRERLLARRQEAASFREALRAGGAHAA